GIRTVLEDRQLIGSLFHHRLEDCEGIDDRHPLRNLQDDDEKVNQLIAYLLGQS
ncbi:MAG: hypothetical protein HN489_07020, partial [Opitutae bacterium]|nr:hypothetical protein [Opitutae bacterium]